MHWGPDRLKLLIKGLKKLTLSQMASKLHGDLPLLNDAVVGSVAKLAKREEDDSVPCAALPYRGNSCVPDTTCCCPCTNVSGVQFKAPPHMIIKGMWGLPELACHHETCTGFTLCLSFFGVCCLDA